MTHAVTSINIPLESPSTVAELLVQAKTALSYAQAEQWESLVEWAVHWHDALVLLLNSRELELGQTVDKKTLQQFIEINEQLVDMVRNARDSIAEQLKYFSRGRRAVRIYHEGIQ